MRVVVVLLLVTGCGEGGLTIREGRADDGGSAATMSAGGPAATGGGSSAGGGVVAAGGAPASAGGVAGGASGGATTAGGSARGAAPEVDDAQLVTVSLPSSLPCGQQAIARVTMRNTGTTTWTASGGYKLGAVGDSDPFSAGRYELPPGTHVAPGQTWEFELSLQAPSSSLVGTSDWRMVREQVRWFGETTTQQVSVSCGPPTFDLSSVVIQGAPPGAPDVRGFAVTSSITSLAFRPDTFSIDHTKRGQWPPVVIAPDGTTQEATVWVFFRIGGVWYGTGGERLRPNQTDKQLTKASDIGPGWLYDPNRWGPMTNYVPQPGEYVAFMVVAGSTRSDANSPVQERSRVVLLPFPVDFVTTSFPAFAWEEP